MATRASAPARRRAGGADDDDVDPALPQKKRARHRLIGAVVLCGVAAVLVPLLLDSEPSRPPSDIAIVIPSKDTPLPPRAGEPKGAVARGALDAPADATRPAAVDATVGRATDAKGVESKGTEAKGVESKGADAKGADSKGTDAKAAEPKAAEARAPAEASKPGEARATEAKPAEASAAAKPADAKAPAAKAEPARKDTAGKDSAGKDEIAQLAESAQARAATQKAGEPRYLLQVGAYAGESGAAAAVERVNALGLRAFTEKVKTDAGDRIRVRVGPFGSRESAEQARAKLQAAGVQAAMIAPPSAPAPAPSR